MTDERVGREGWEAVWRGCLESTRRLLEEGVSQPVDELAAVIDLPVSEDEPEGDG